MLTFSQRPPVIPYGLTHAPAVCLVSSYKLRQPELCLGNVHQKRNPVPQPRAQVGVVQVERKRVSPEPSACRVDPFDWARQWYPVAYIAELDAGRPHPIELLGQRLVVWRDDTATWRCFKDRCPHRLAPLSEGRVEDNGKSLMCSYHGWEFKGDGKCISIPQAVDPKAQEVACASQRSCATSYPTQVGQDMLWIWGDTSPTAFIDSAGTLPAFLPELDPTDASRTAGGDPVLEIDRKYMRDVPYSWAAMVENLMDTSHVPFAHHGVLGDRYKEGAGDVLVTPTQADDPCIFSPEGLSMDVRVKMEVAQALTDYTIKVQFVPPCLLRYFFRFPQGRWRQMAVYVIPTAPGKSRLLHSVIQPASDVPVSVRLSLKLRPLWVDHLRRHLISDGDGMMLHVAERLLAQEKESRGEGWRRSYYMPAPADRLVSAFRQWLDSHGGPPTPDSQLGPIIWDKPYHVDHYNQHTKHCAKCRKALSMLRAMRFAVAAIGVLAVMSSMVLALAPAGTQPMWLAPCLLAAGMAVLAGGWVTLSNIASKFVHVPYDHQARN